MHSLLLNDTKSIWLMYSSVPKTAIIDILYIS